MGQFWLEIFFNFFNSQLKVISVFVTVFAKVVIHNISPGFVEISNRLF